MAKMLLRELTYLEQMNLAGLSKHPGFDVLVEIMDEAVREAAADPIRLDPIKTEHYEEKLKMLTLMARCTNDFCMTVRNTVNVHINAALAKQKQDELDAEIDQETDRVLSTVRLLDQKDNQE